MSIAENVADVRERILRAAPGARGQLVAATKMNDADRVREAVAAGVDACGENRVQELLEKNALGAYAGAALDFIGHLQKNKVKYLVGAVRLIQSVDSGALLAAVDARARALGVVQDVLLEVNIGGEGLPPVLALAAAMPGVRVRGLMAIPPVCAGNGGSRPYFDRMRELFVDIGEKKYDNVCMDFLSMGMSGDFEDAVRCGANMVRVGTAIFGARDYGPHAKGDTQ